MIGRPIVPRRQSLQRQGEEHEVTRKSKLPGSLCDRNHDCSPRHCCAAGVRFCPFHASPQAVSRAHEIAEV